MHISDQPVTASNQTVHLRMGGAQVVFHCKSFLEAFYYNMFISFHAFTSSS